MKPDEMARLYADAAENLSSGWLEAGSAVLAANRRLADAALVWCDEGRAAEEVLARAAWRSGEETKDVFEDAEGLRDATFLTRFGDLARAQAFLWTAAGLASGERLGRAVSAGGEALPGFAELVGTALSPRSFVLGVAATELWSGYAALRERARWAPGLVRDEDWELQHRRGAGCVLDVARALGGP